MLLYPFSMRSRWI